MSFNFNYTINLTPAAVNGCYALAVLSDYAVRKNS